MLFGMAEPTSSRLLSLLSLLQGRRDWPGGELASRLEVSARTIRRDVDRLRQLGYPVESLSGPAGGYRLAAGAAMPPLLLDDEEAIAIAVGLQSAANSGVGGIEETSMRALVKLQQVLPAHLRRRVQALHEATTTVTWGAGASVDPQCLIVLAAACRDHERVRFGYTARDEAVTKRETEPHSLVRLGRTWYLVAWDCGRGAWRTFRVDRIDGPPSPAGVRAMARTLPGRKTPQEFVEASLGRTPQRYEAVVTLHCPAREVPRDALRWGRVTPIDEQRCELRTGDDDLRWLALRLTMLDAEFEVHEPPELIERLQWLSARLSRASGSGDGGHQADGASVPA